MPGDFVDFVSEAVRTYLYEADHLVTGAGIVSTGPGHLDAARSTNICRQRR